MSEKKLKNLKPELFYQGNIGEIDGTELKPVIPDDPIGPKVKSKKFKDLKPEIAQSDAQGTGANKLD